MNLRTLPILACTLAAGILLTDCRASGSAQISMNIRPLAAGDDAAALGKVKSFAFGGIGVAGTTSQGEALFRTVLAGKDALAQFQSVLSKGTPEAKLYALCGIRALNPSGFEAAASALIKANPQVETIAGCMIGKQPAATVAKQIGSGDYDRHFIKK